MEICAKAETAEVRVGVCSRNNPLRLPSSGVGFEALNGGDERTNLPDERTPVRFHFPSSIHPPSCSLELLAAWIISMTCTPSSELGRDSRKEANG
jgi:hypothetical protein